MLPHAPEFQPRKKHVYGFKLCRIPVLQGTARSSSSTASGNECGQISRVKL